MDEQAERIKAGPEAKKPSPFKKPEENQPPPARKKAIEVANQLIETGRIIANLKIIPNEESRRINRRLFSIIETRVKKARKSLGKLEVEYNREKLL